MDKHVKSQGLVENPGNVSRVLKLVKMFSSA